MRFSLPPIKWLLPVSDYCRARGKQIVEHSSDNETEFDNTCSRKLGRVAEHLIDGSEKRICRLSLELWSPHVIEKHSNERINMSAEVNCRIKRSYCDWQYTFII